LCILDILDGGRRWLGLAWVLALGGIQEGGIDGDGIWYEGWVAFYARGMCEYDIHSFIAAVCDL
jgi:hypothetical protein